MSMAGRTTLPESQDSPASRKAHSSASHRNVLRLPRWVSVCFPPSTPLSLLALCGFSAEATFLATGRPHLYQTDPSTILFGLVFLLWFWTSLAWILDRVGWHWYENKRANRPIGWRMASTVSLSLLLASGVTLYALSWWLFFRSGRFATAEVLRFVYFNADHMWDYMLAAELPHLLLGLGVLVSILGILPWLLSWCVAPPQRVAVFAPRQHATAWVVLSIIAMICWRAIPSEPSVLRNSARMHVLKNGLHPGFSLYVSRSQSGQPTIEPDLDRTLLTPLAPVPAKAARDTITSLRNKPSIIFVAVESLRSDVIYQWHQGKEILPNINGLARNGVQLTRAYSQSTHSDYADPCLVSSLYPLRALRHHYYGPRDPWPVTRIYDVLKPLGYSTAIISSQNEAWGGMDHFLQSQHLDLFLHPETRPADTMVADRDPGFAREVRLGGLVAGKFPDAYTADQAIAWIREQAAADKPFFLSMNLQSSHFPYLMPDHVPRPFQPARLSSNVSFVDYPPEETETVRNAYFNAIHECDRQIGRLVAALTELQKLDNTILVVTGENGEAFHECGSVTHASNPVEPAIHVACVIHAPKFLEARVEDYPFEHVDLVPTVLGITEEGLAELGTTSQDVASQGVAGPETAALGVAELDRHPNFQGINIFSVERPALDERLLFCHVLSSLAEADSVLLAGRWKLTHDYRSNEQSLYDVVDDPGQTRNLISTHDQIADRLRAALAEWRQRQLAYYQHPAYYLNYYPPPPPRN